MNLKEAIAKMEALHLDAWYDNGSHFTCQEMEALHDLFIALGLNDAADALYEGHADGDDEGDEHYREQSAERRERIGLAT